MANKSKYGPMMRINYDKIKETIEKEHLTGEEVSTMMGLHKKYLAFTGGKRGALPFDIIKQLSDLSGVKFEDFLADSKTETEKSEDDEKIVETVEEEAMPKTAYLTDGEDTMSLQFSENEFRRIVELTKHFKLNQTTKLFHKLLNDAWFKYRKEKLKDELGRLPEAELLKRYIASVFGTDNYNKDDLVRKIADDAMRRYSDV